MENLNNFTNSQKLGEIDIVNSRKKGSLLEWIVKRVFQIAGFYATNKANFNKNQIDVFANYNDKKIIVQCKQYEKSTPPVKDLIHEWNSKREEIECDKVVLALWGYPRIVQDELKLAKKLNVCLWNDPIIFNFFNLISSDPNKAKEEILLNLEIDSNESQRIVESLKKGIENRFKDFSLEDKSLMESLKKEIFSCFKDGTLIKQKNFEILWQFLKEKEFFIGPSRGRMFNIMSDESIFKYRDDFEIRKFVRRAKLYEKGKGIIGVANVTEGFESITPDAIDKDGITLIRSKHMFN